MQAQPTRESVQAQLGQINAQLVQNGIQLEALTAQKEQLIKAYEQAQAVLAGIEIESRRAAEEAAAKAEAPTEE